MSAGTAPAGRRKILLVDDSSTALMMEKLLLARSGYDVVTARDGQEGVEKALSEKPDLIVLDVMMPRLDGFGACRALREREETQHIPVIMVTTRGEAADVQRGYDSGCNDYVTKPINATEFYAKVMQLLAGA